MIRINATKLAQARIKLGLNISDVSKMTGIARSTITKLEGNTETHPRARTVSTLANIYKKDVSDLLKGEEV